MPLARRQKRRRIISPAKSRSSYQTRRNCHSDRRRDLRRGVRLVTHIESAESTSGLFAIAGFFNCRWLSATIARHTGPFHQLSRRTKLVGECVAARMLVRPFYGDNPSLTYDFHKPWNDPANAVPSSRV